jgi:hypothetical protein
MQLLSERERKGVKEIYYQVEYDLGIVFGPAGIEFKFLYQGRVMSSAGVKYARVYVG